MRVRYSDRTSYFCAWRFYSAILFFYLPPAHLSLVCLVILVAGCITFTHSIISASPFSSSFSTSSSFYQSPLGYPMRNCLGEHTVVSHPMGLNFLFGAHH
ncbi:hypothetical protein GGI43DRAFT_338981 [Trichoderma evansii]